MLSESQLDLLIVEINDWWKSEKTEKFTAYTSLPSETCRHINGLDNGVRLMREAYRIVNRISGENEIRDVQLDRFMIAVCKLFETLVNKEKNDIKAWNDELERLNEIEEETLDGIPKSEFGYFETNIASMELTNDENSYVNRMQRAYEQRGMNEKTRNDK